MERTRWSLTNHVAECILEPWLVSDLPVCGGFRWLRGFLLKPQPPLLTRRGMRPQQYVVNSFTRSQPWVNVRRDDPALKGRQNGVLSPFRGSRSTELRTQG